MMTPVATAAVAAAQCPGPDLTYKELYGPDPAQGCEFDTPALNIAYINSLTCCSNFCTWDVPKRHKVHFSYHGILSQFLLQVFDSFHLAVLVYKHL